MPYILAVHARQPRPHHFLARTAAGSLGQTRRAPRLGHATAASTSWPPNDLGCTLQAALLESEERPVGYARYLFLDPRAKDSCLERETVAHDPVASLRSQAGRALPDSTLTAVSGDLSAHSKELQRHGRRMSSASTTPGTKLRTTRSRADSSSPGRSCSYRRSRPHMGDLHS
ncbi:hypothetical protein [Streptomyces sp. NPDC092129]|uniref:MmyB family transcriptional regulator n=1 Tax=Streptomyces sp. NPDC092129 TaxID=3366010 RepID=UPI00382B7273